MGQKVNPVGFRLGINRGWDSVWYAKKKDFGNYLIEDFKIRDYIKKNVVNSGVSKVMIERTSNKCYVTIYTSRPGFVIGKKGSDIDKIKNNLSKFTKNEVALNIKEVKKPETNAFLVAENIAQQLVKRISYRRAMKRSMQSCIRLGINRGWDSVWYAKKKDFGNYLIEDFKIRDYIKKNVVNSGVSKVMIERTSNKCYVTIYTSRPGFVIGKKGSDIDKIKNNLSKFTTNEVALNIKEVKKPETNAYLVAENIAQQLVKRISYRRAMKRSMQSCIRLGARGIKVSISGRLGGNEIARTEWLREGSIPSHTLRADIDYAEAEALTTYGIIGIKVWIYKGEVFAREFSQETNKVTPKEGKE